MKSLVVAALVLSGCHASEQKSPPKKPEVDLLGSGAEPRQVIAYALPKGTHTSVELAMDVTVSAGAQGTTLPTFVLTLDEEVVDVLPDHRMKLRTAISDAAVREREGSLSAAAVATPLEAMKGVAITATLAPDGKISEAALDLGTKQVAPAEQQQLDSLTQSWQDLAMRLPTEPVGVGAKWRSTRQVRRGGMATVSTATVEVTKLDGSKLGYTVAIDTTGADQTITESGAAIDVKHIHGGGKGTGTVDLATLAISGELALELASDMSAQGQDTPMKLTITMTTTPK